MNRDKSKLELRKEYIRNRVNSSPNKITKEVRLISKDLFISERTVYRDLE
jgi:hypothetical protein